MQIRKLIFQSSIKMEQALAAIKRNKLVSQQIIYKVIHHLISTRCVDIYNALENPDTKSNSDEDLYASILSILEIRESLLILSQHLVDSTNMHELALHIKNAANILFFSVSNAIEKIEQQKKHAQYVWKTFGVGLLVSREFLLPHIDREYYPLLAGLIPFLSFGTDKAQLEFSVAIQKSLDERDTVLSDMSMVLKELNNKRRGILVQKLVRAEINDETALMISKTKGMAEKFYGEPLIPVLNEMRHNKKSDKKLQRFILKIIQPEVLRPRAPDLSMNSFILNLMRQHPKSVFVKDMKTSQPLKRVYQSLFLHKPSIQKPSVMLQSSVVKPKN
jgi:hypothetical protein